MTSKVEQFFACLLKMKSFLSQISFSKDLKEKNLWKQLAQHPAHKEPLSLFTVHTFPITERTLMAFLLCMGRDEQGVWTLFFWQDSGPHSASAVLSDTCQDGVQRLNDIPSASLAFLDGRGFEAVNRLFPPLCWVIDCQSLQGPLETI